MKLKLTDGEVAAGGIHINGGQGLYRQEGGRTVADEFLLGSSRFSSGGLGLATAEIAGGELVADQLIVDRRVRSARREPTSTSETSSRRMEPILMPAVRSRSTAGYALARTDSLISRTARPRFRSTGRSSSSDRSFGFFNASRASIAIDEHSLVITPVAGLLEGAFGSVANEGLVHVLGDPLTIPADREIRGEGDLTSAASRTSIAGTLIGKGERGISLTKFDMLPGGVAELGNGTVWSLPTR